MERVANRHRSQRSHLRSTSMKNEVPDRRTPSAVVVALWVLNSVFLLSYALTFLIASGHWHEWGTQNYLPFSGNRMFDYGDFTMYYQKTYHLTTAKALVAGAPTYNYPAPAAFLYSAMFHLSHPLTVYKLSLVLMAAAFSFVTLYFLLCKSSARRPVDRPFAIAATTSILLTTFASYPILFTAYRGNLEDVALMIFAAGLLLFITNHETGAAVIWGIGIAIKPFPALLFLLLLRRRKFTSFAIGIATSLLLQSLALYRLGPGVLQATKDLSSGFDLYKKLYIFTYRPFEARFQHSLFDCMRTLQHLAHPENVSGIASGVLVDNPAIKAMYPYYLAVSILVAGTCLVHFRRMPVLNQIFAIILLILLLPPVSADYTSGLLHLPFLLWFFWLKQIQQSSEPSASQRLLVGLCVCFALAFSAQNWFLEYSGLLHTAVFFALLAIAAALPMPLLNLDSPESLNIIGSP